MKMGKGNLLLVMKRVRFILMLSIFAAVFVLHVQGGAHLILGRLIDDLRRLGNSYDEKMQGRREWYDLISFIRENTPDDANIVFPAGRYERIGNFGLNQYFLLPRRLYTGNGQKLKTLKSPAFLVVLKEFPASEVQGLRIMKNSAEGLVRYQGNPR